MSSPQLDHQQTPITSTVCWDHLYGRCQRGDECRHFHLRVTSDCQQELHGDELEPVVWFTTPCYHFMKGRCSLKDKCRFIHDTEVVNYREANPNAADGAHHCWAYIQDMCDKAPCKFSHPANKVPFLKYTPCLRAPGCAPGCPLKHQKVHSASPSVPTFPEFITGPVLPVPIPQIPMMPTYYLPPMHHMQMPSPPQMILVVPSPVPQPLAVEANGMVYYNYLNLPA
ncbi:hypothetical protein BDZ89DRAFT_1157958 [Hymenopellis radicata]|nr:hypothetical protein BDZ89DRAFT_1157958 [Hymenopellis radicata]